MKTGHVQGCVDFFTQFVKWIFSQEAQFLFSDLARGSGNGVGGFEEEGNFSSCIFSIQCSG